MTGGDRLAGRRWTAGVTVKEDDPEISVSKPAIPGDAGEVQAYLARPKGNDAFPAVILIHENRGLTDQCSAPAPAGPGARPCWR